MRHLSLLILLLILALASPGWGAPAAGRFADLVVKGPWVDIRAYGAIPNDANDDTPAFKKAIDAATDGTAIVWPKGIYKLNTVTLAGYANSALTIPASNVSLISAGATIELTGGGDCGIFYAKNKSGLTVRGFRFIGNGVNAATGTTKGSAIWFENDDSAPAVMENYTITDNELENFRGDYWITVRNIGATYDTSNVWVQRNRFKSVSGNSKAPTDGGTPANAVNIAGNSAAAAGRVTNAWVTDNVADCYYIKSFLSAWVNIKNVHVTGNYIDSPGVSGASSAGNAYGMYFYKMGSGTVSEIYVSDNHIRNPYSNGIYLQGATQFTVSKNHISGQVDTVDAGLPRAGIAINGYADGAVSGNIINNCYRGISIVNQSNSDNNLALTSNILTQTTATAGTIGIKLLASYQSSGLTIATNTITGYRHGIWGGFTATTGYRNVAVTNNNISSTTICIQFTTLSGSAWFGYATIAANTLQSSGTGVLYLDDPNLGHISVKDNDLIGPTTSTMFNIQTVNLTSIDNVDIRDNTFRDQTGTGYAITLKNVRGSLANNQFLNVLDTRRYFSSGAEDLGNTTPTWTGLRGNYVQALMPQEAGSAGSRYIVNGWTYDPSGTPGWREVRTLTGN